MNCCLGHHPDGDIMCRFYDICRSKLKDVKAEECKIRFDYETQARRKFIIGSLTFIDIEKAQQGEK